MTARKPVRLSLALAAILLGTGGLAGCGRDADQAGEPAPAPGQEAAAVTLAPAAAPFEFESRTPYADVSLKLPEAVKAQPDLHAQLYSAAVRDLRQFTEGAQADRTEAGGDQGQPPYERIITFDDPLETGKLLSLTRTDYDYSGGAHGNVQFAGVLWDKALKRAVAPTDLFRQGADQTPLDVALCLQINAAKSARDPQAAPIMPGGRDWACPRAAQTPFVLAAGSAPGKAGGLTFLIAPYVIGPYAEGTWKITVPQTAFRSLLASAYADEFAGEPAPPAPAEAGA